MSKITGAIRAIVEADKPADSEVAIQVRSSNHILPASRRWNALGMDANKILGATYGHIARAEECRKILHDRRDQLRTDLEDARKAFAAGTVEIDELDRVAAAFDRIDDAKSSLSKSLNAAVAVAFDAGERAFTESIEDDVWPFLVAGAAQAAARSADVARNIPAYVNTREQARQEGYAAEWGTLGGIVASWDDFHTERAKLTQIGLFPGLDNPHALLNGAPGQHGLVTNFVHVVHLWLKYRYPEKLPTNFYSEVQPEMRLATADRVGAEPGMYSVATATANIGVWRSRVLALPNGGAIEAVSNLPGVSTSGAMALLGTRTADSVHVSD